MRIGRVVSEVGPLAVGAEVSEPNVKPFFALVDEFGVCAVLARPVKQKLNQLRWQLVLIFLKVDLEFVQEVLLDALVFKLQN